MMPLSSLENISVYLYGFLFFTQNSQANDYTHGSMGYTNRQEKGGKGFISDPYLFILDEPDSGLDGVLARDLMKRLHDISREGKIVIVITHSPDRVADLFDDVIILAKDEERTGRLVFYGEIEKAKSFFGTNNLEQMVRMINRKEEGGEGLADELIEKYGEIVNA